MRRTAASTVGGQASPARRGQPRAHSRRYEKARSSAAKPERERERERETERGRTSECAWQKTCTLQFGQENSSPSHAKRASLCVGDHMLSTREHHSLRKLRKSNPRLGDTSSSTYVRSVYVRIYKMFISLKVIFVVSGSEFVVSGSGKIGA